MSTLPYPDGYHPDQSLVHLTQKCFVFTNERLLVLRRTETAPARPLTWDLPGGALITGEEPLHAMAREVTEETGLVPNDLAPVTLRSRFNEVDQFWVTVYYQARVASETVTLSCEHDQYQWVTPEEFEALDVPERWRGILGEFL
jgi:8-oxo-dGTP diphosphatase